jgi:hypothetical protein
MRVTTSVTEGAVGFDGLRAVVGAGEGVVGRFPGIVCVAQCADPEPLREFLSVCADLAGREPGRALARRLATWMSGPESPGPQLRFGTIAAAGDQLAVFLVGDVDARIDAIGGLTLSGAHAAVGTDRLLPRPASPVVLSLNGGEVRADPADVHDLRAGIVPGAGVVLRPSGAESEDHAEETGTGGHEWFDTGEVTSDPFPEPLRAQDMPVQRAAGTAPGGRNGSTRAVGPEPISGVGESDVWPGASPDGSEDPLDDGRAAGGRPDAVQADPPNRESSARADDHPLGGPDAGPSRRRGVGAGGDRLTGPDSGPDAFRNREADGGSNGELGAGPNRGPTAGSDAGFDAGPGAFRDRDPGGGSNGDAGPHAWPNRGAGLGAGDDRLSGSDGGLDAGPATSRNRDPGGGSNGGPDPGPDLWPNRRPSIGPGDEFGTGPAPRSNHELRAEPDAGLPAGPAAWPNREPFVAADDSPLVGPAGGPDTGPTGADDHPRIGPDGGPEAGPSALPNREAGAGVNGELDAESAARPSREPTAGPNRGSGVEADAGLDAGPFPQREPSVGADHPPAGSGAAPTAPTDGEQHAEPDGWGIADPETGKSAGRHALEIPSPPTPARGADPDPPTDLSTPQPGAADPFGAYPPSPPPRGPAPEQADPLGGNLHPLDPGATNERDAGPRPGGEPTARPQEGAGGPLPTRSPSAGRSWPSEPSAASLFLPAREPAPEPATEQPPGPAAPDGFASPPDQAPGAGRPPPLPPTGPPPPDPGSPGRPPSPRRVPPLPPQTDVRPPRIGAPATGPAPSDHGTEGAGHRLAVEAPTSRRGPRIRGYRCENGHLNDPRSPSCRECGAPIDERVGGLVAGPRPVLGRLLFDDGAAHLVDGGYLVGRTPEADERVRTGELRPIPIDDQTGSISGAHAEIRVSGWDVMVVDTGSEHGTYVSGPDEGQWTPLPPRRSRRLLPGARVRVGGRTFTFESSSTVC